MTFIFLANIGATLFMCGLIWVIQIVHYPLFARVGTDGFVGYQSAHMRLISFIVMPVMSIELVTSVWLVIQPPLWAPPSLLWVGLTLVILIWLSTAVWQAPKHGILVKGFDPAVHRFLVRSNWVRTICWTLRAGLALWLINLGLN